MLPFSQTASRYPKSLSNEIGGSILVFCTMHVLRVKTEFPSDHIDRAPFGFIVNLGDVLAHDAQGKHVHTAKERNYDHQ